MLQSMLRPEEARISLLLLLRQSRPDFVMLENVSFEVLLLRTDADIALDLILLPNSCSVESFI